MRSTRLVVVCTLALLASLGFISASAGFAAKATPGELLASGVTVEGIMEHEREFQNIADANNGNRAAATTGYDASAEYVADRLRAAGYKVNVQEFDFDEFIDVGPSELERISPSPEEYTDGTDFSIMSYSGSGDATAPVIPIDVDIPPPADSNTIESTSGCEPEDFEDSNGQSIVTGNIALIQRGTCPFGVKAENAEQAGAVGVVIFNEGNPLPNPGDEDRTELLLGTLGEETFVDIPVVGTTFALGEELVELYRANQDPRVRIKTETTINRDQETTNVIARTNAGDPDKAVVVGAHLDSVPEGPGINDNGSGSATILEIAEQLKAQKIKPRNQVRFAFWGAEESGLVGSNYYVDQLSNKQLKKIAVNLNFDMLGSPNYARFVYDGDGSAFSEAGPNGSGLVENVFNNYFEREGLDTEPTAFDGRSDYFAFINAGIPAGGLFSGAEDIKSQEIAKTDAGGVYGVAYDPCYHQACDSFTPVADGADASTYAAIELAYGEENLEGNLNLLALDELGDGAAYATGVFLNRKRPVEDPESAQRQATSDEPLPYRGDQLVR
jgi:Zn-dependent M28 family amino/carboxypeptidase